MLNKSTRQNKSDYENEKNEVLALLVNKLISRYYRKNLTDLELNKCLEEVKKALKPSNLHQRLTFFMANLLKKYKALSKFMHSHVHNFFQKLRSVAC